MEKNPSTMQELGHLVFQVVTFCHKCVSVGFPPKVWRNNFRSTGQF